MVGSETYGGGASTGELAAAAEKGRKQSIDSGEPAGVRGIPITLGFESGRGRISCVPKSRGI